MANWITCTQLDGRVVCLNMDVATVVTEEAGDRSAVCFGSGERDRVVLLEPVRDVVALTGASAAVRPKSPKSG